MQVGSGSLGRPPHPRLQGLSRSSHSLHVSVGLFGFCVLITLATASRNVHYHVTATVEALAGPSTTQSQSRTTRTSAYGIRLVSQPLRG